MPSTLPVPEKKLQQWHSPSSRTDVIQELIHGVDRYNPNNLSWMEEYLGTQVGGEDYDLLANLAILKLYQFNPQMSNPDSIINILLKSLSATIHGPDFNLCLSLLREPTAILQDIDTDDQSLAVVMPFLQRLHDLSRECRFTAFWKEFNGDSEAASIVKNHYATQQPNLIPALRNLFAASIASSFSRVSVKHLSNWLDLPASEVASWAEGAQWSVEGEYVVVPKNEDNNVKAGIVKENVELSQLTKLVAGAAF